MSAAFTEVTACWVCGGAGLHRVHDSIIDLDIYRDQHPALAAYSGERVWFNRCDECGFTQPERLPALPGFFDCLYDQLWSPEWVQREFEGTYKDLIFGSILDGLAARRIENRRLLDVGAHAGRFLHLAHAQGWQPEGIELNPRTAAYAARRTRLPVHCGNIEDLALAGGSYGAVTLIDVLEHIPDPLRLLSRVRDGLARGGWVAIKLPSAAAQRLKETARSWLRPGYTPRLADNLVHVNHFTPGSLALALTRSGFDRVAIGVGAPELPQDGGRATMWSNGLRRAVYAASALLPGGVHTPLALNLQAFARRSQ